MSLCGAGRVEPGNAWRMWCCLASLQGVEDLRKRLLLARLGTASAKSMSAMTHICPVNLHAQLRFPAPGFYRKQAMHSEKGGSHGVYSVKLLNRGDQRKATWNLGIKNESKKERFVDNLFGTAVLEFWCHMLQLLDIFAADTHGCNLSWHGVLRAFPLTHMLPRCIHGIMQVTCTHNMTTGLNAKTSQTLLLDGFPKGSQESSQRCLG